METTEMDEITEVTGVSEVPDGDPAAMPAQDGEPAGGHPSGASAAESVPAEETSEANDGDPAAMPAQDGEPAGGHPSGASATESVPAEETSEASDGDPAAEPAQDGEPAGGHPSGASATDTVGVNEVSDATDGDPAAMPAQDSEPAGGHPSGASAAKAVPAEETSEATDGDPAAYVTSEAASPAPPSAETLLCEIAQLKERLDRAEKERSRIAGEIAEFRTLYPDVSPDSLSASVWDAFSRGVPLAASFALEERYRARAAELAKATNERNRENASPSAGSTVPTGFYSPDEVRAMSSPEVRTHYAAILDSMKHWDR